MRVQPVQALSVLLLSVGWLIRDFHVLTDVPWTLLEGALSTVTGSKKEGRGLLVGFHVDKIKRATAL